MSIDIWVVAFEPRDPERSGVGGYEWFYNAGPANEFFDKIDDGDSDVYLFRYYPHLPGEEITDELEPIFSDPSPVAGLAIRKSVGEKIVVSEDLLDALLIPAPNSQHRIARGWDCTCIYLISDGHVDRYQHRKGCDGLNYVHEILDGMSDPDQTNEDEVRAVLQAWKNDAPHISFGGYVDGEWTDELNTLLERN